MANQKIHSIMIIEVAGRPPEHLLESIKAHIDKLAATKGLSLVNTKISEPRKMEDEEDLYTSFAEVEITVGSFSQLIEIIFDYMPSSVEIMDPEDINFNCQEATMFANDLAGRLHRYDEIAKIAQLQVKQLAQKFREIQQTSQLPKAQNVNNSALQPIRITMGSNEKIAPKQKKIKAKSKKKK